jgi:hypothetical protein
MTRVLPLHPPEPPEMQARAMDNLRFIRETMEAAATFTAVSGWGTVVIGLTAIAAAALAAMTQSTTRWIFIWLCEAALSVAISVYTMALKARAARLPLWSEPARKILFSFAPPMAGGALLTLVLFERGLVGLLPGVWMLLYGIGVVAAGTFSVRIVPVMGVAFMTVGTAALFTPAHMGTEFMAAGFGGLHLLFGTLIARRHGG